MQKPPQAAIFSGDNKNGKYKKTWCPNLKDKKDMNQAWKHGLILKVHRVIKFEQSIWVKLLYHAERQAKNTWDILFAKNIAKLMKNGVFRKTMENITNYKETKLVTRRENTHFQSKYLL